MMPEPLQKAVIEGIQRLIVLRLPGSPASDTLPALQAIWIDALLHRPITWNVERDLPRIQQAFRWLEGTAEKWPNPAVFLQCLPPVPEQLKLTPPRDYKVPQQFKDLVKRLRSGMPG